MERPLAFSFTDKEFTDFLPEYPQEQFFTRWADFNIHDPGVTSYEALQFSFEDFTYRLNLPISVLLQGRKGNAFSSWSVHDLRPYYAVTVDDYRRLLSCLNDVVNAVVFPCVEANVAPGTTAPKSLLTIEAAAFSSYLSAFSDEYIVQGRALGEYFNRKAEDRHFVNSNVKPVDVKIDVTFEYREDSELNMAKVICAVSDFLLPRLKPMNFRYLKNAQDLIESESFGPVGRLNPNKTVIAGAMYKPCYRESIAVSEIYDLLESFSFLTSVNSVEIALSNRQIYTGTVLQLGRYCFTPMNKIVINNVDNTPLWPSLICDEQSVIYDMEPEQSKERYHQLGQFFSIQESFPNNYGIGSNLIDKTPTELAQSANFRAYLYFMDQIRADYLAQLGNFPRIFTVNNAICKVKKNSLEDYPYYKDLDISPIDCAQVSLKDRVNCKDMHIEPLFREQRLNFLLAQNGWTTDREIPTETAPETLLLIKREFLDLVHNPIKCTRHVNTELNFIFRSRSLVMLQEMVRVLLQTEIAHVRILEHVFLQPVWNLEQSMDFSITIFLFGDNLELSEDQEFKLYLKKLLREVVPVHILFNLVWHVQDILTFDTMLMEAFPPKEVFYFDKDITRHQRLAMTWLLAEIGSHALEN